MRIFIDRGRLPLSAELRTAPLTKAGYEYALYGGEDYQLIFTMPPVETAELADGSITVIGEVIEGETGVVLRCEDGTEEELLPRGYQHF